jgi:hypothetical protein
VEIAIGGIRNFFAILNEDFVATSQPPFRCMFVVSFSISVISV